jgi:hypothetical protein
VVGSEPEVARNFTWAVLGMEDGKFGHLGGVTKWNSHILIHTWTFLAIISIASQLFLCLFWISLWLKNRCLQHPCFKNLCKIAQASKNSDSNAQHFLSYLLTHSWIHSILFALPGYQFPYTVMNRCLIFYQQVLSVDIMKIASIVQRYSTVQLQTGNWDTQYHGFSAFKLSWHSPILFEQWNIHHVKNGGGCACMAGSGDLFPHEPGLLFRTTLFKCCTALQAFGDA